MESSPIDQAVRVHPDIIVMDMSLPGWMDAKRHASCGPMCARAPSRWS